MNTDTRFRDDWLLLKEKKPLIHNITNYVAMNFCANALLAVGASPLMSFCPEEMTDIVAKADAVCINLGCLDNQIIKAARIAAASSMEFGKPWVLDPVGVGISRLRTATTLDLVTHYKPAIIRANASEIITIALALGLQPTPFPIERCNPSPYTTERCNPSPDTAEHGNPSPYTAERCNPSPDTAEHGNPSPDTAEHGNPSPDTTEHSNPSPYTAEHGNPSPDTTERCNPSPDTAEHGNQASTCHPIQNYLSAAKPQGRGVDSTIDSGDAISIAEELARETGTVIAMSGRTDYVTDGRSTIAIANGHPMMARVTAMGCVASALTAAFAAVAAPMQAAIDALTLMGVCGELAAKDCPGTASFAVRFIDMMSIHEPHQLSSLARTSVSSPAITSTPSPSITSVSASS